MRYGITSDIHGNLTALETVIQSAGTVDGWICLGDTVGYGPLPNECIQRVRDICETVLIGNHDLAAIGRLDTSWFNPHARAAAEWTQQALTPESKAYLESLPEMRVCAEWDVTFSHGSLTDPPRDYILSRLDARTNFRLLETQTLFIGHSHLSEYFTMKDGRNYCDEEVFTGSDHLVLKPGYRYIVNCGSVGQPRDGDARAAFGILDTEAHTVDVTRVPYDVERVQARMQAEGLPDLLAERLSRGL